MRKIRSVSIAANESNDILGETLAIFLNNGQTILLSLKSKAEDINFSSMCKNNHFLNPETDGERIYWRDGPSLSFEEIMGMIEL